eukprot:TRINITY_DN2277_c0_g1_i1.p1 TRINITY_DN2277_c0_g1~~TRINITY_DN2277_c0_g1_i1.p1  ORF type:complete len:551 (-),score=81.26 TRINITY_DN2277_c0_g1_i1:34-1686(-)
MKRKDGYSTPLDAIEIKRRQDAKADRRNRAIVRDGIREELKRRDEVVHGKADAGTIYQQFTQSNADKEKWRQQERQKLAQEAADAARPRKLFICGDARGSFTKLFSTVEAQNKKVGPFDAMFCVGNFMSASGTGDEGASAYLKGEKQLPLDCYFVDPGPVLLQAAPKGKSLCNKLFFLGAYGVREIHGLRVAYLSGHYDPLKYNNDAVDFVGGAFTAKAIGELQRLVVKDKKQRGVDVLLTCGWPAGCDQNIEDETQRPPKLGDGHSWQQFCAPPLAELCFAIEPRYHIFGSANIFYQRPPFQTQRRKHPCRCIGLGQVGSVGKQQKWLHALALSPMAHMKREELIQTPASSTSCPFTLNKQERVPDAAQDRETPHADSEQLLQNALSSLSQGDISAYCEAEGKLCSNPFMFRSAASEGCTEDTAAAASSSTSAGTAGEAVVDDSKTKAAEKWLKREPGERVVRYTFNDSGPLGLRLSKDVPPWILEVKDGHLGARKAPRVPLGGVVLAINGIQLNEEDSQEATKALSLRPLIMDIRWPEDQEMPPVKHA